MNTNRIARAIGGGLAGFLLIICVEGILFLAFLISFNPLGSSTTSPLSWFLMVVVAIPLIVLAPAVPAIIISGNKKTSLISGIIACIFAIIIFTNPFQKSRGVFDTTETFASVTLISISMLTISLQLAEERKKRVGIILGTWMVFSILGVAISSFSQAGGGLTVLLAWLALPAIVANLQSEIDIFSS